MSATFAFRVDASRVIGSGHVMRCLALANHLHSQGATCHFICRALTGNLIGKLEQAGFVVHVLEGGTVLDPRPDDYSTWAQVSWQQDATETKAIVQALTADWVVMDHYSFDAQWQKAAVPLSSKCMVIDDLANRNHLCDVLVDANFGRGSSHYDSLVPDQCAVLTGPHFAMLRPEFSAMRAEALLRRQNANLRNILVNFGGVDLPNATSAVLECLSHVDLPPDTQITVVMGGKATGLAAVTALCETFPLPIDVQIDVSDMHLLMSDADLAIGAVGGTTWERAALGLPTLMLTIASNQEPAAKALDDAGVAEWLGPFHASTWRAHLIGALQSRVKPGKLAAEAEKTAAICDGDGIGRVVSQLLDVRVEFREATPSDARRVWEWRYANDAHRFNKNAGLTPYDAHYAWFQKVLLRSDVHYMVLTKADCPLGYVRLDEASDNAAFVSLCISEAERGRGLGRVALATARVHSQKLGIDLLMAEVHQENKASLKLFEAMGYQKSGRNDEFICFELDVKN